MVYAVHLKELEGIIDEMVESGTPAEDIIDACRTATISCLEERGIPVPYRVDKLDIYRYICPGASK